VPFPPDARECRDFILSLSLLVQQSTSTATMSDFVHGDQADVRPSHDGKVPSSPDLEAGSHEKEINTGTTYAADDTDSAEVIKARELQSRGFLKTLRDGEEWLDAKMGIETQGIDRIHEEDKKPPSILNVFFLWWSLTCHVGTLPIGVLGPQTFFLSLNQSIAAIVVGTVLGALCTAYCGTLGPKVSSSVLLCDSADFRSLVCVPLQPLDTLLDFMGQSSAQS
jgi:hypothetical protein